MKLSWGHGVSGARARRRALRGRGASAWALVGTLALALVVGGCGVLGPGEAPTHGIEVWNYSTNQYVVRVTYENGSSAIAVPPRSEADIMSAGLLDLGSPNEAVVMDAECNTQLATLPLADDWVGVVIDESGHAIAPTSFVPGTGDSLPRATAQALPSACS